jgi:hypothetical protein
MTERLTNPDEIVVENIQMFHLESMSPKHLWLSVNCEDGRLFHLNISAKGGKLKYYWSEETDYELAQTPLHRGTRCLIIHSYAIPE